MFKVAFKSSIKSVIYYFFVSPSQDRSGIFGELCLTALHSYIGAIMLSS